MGADPLSLLLVRMGERSCGLLCEHVVEIVPRVRLSRLPDAPPGVLGVINLRGRVVPVVDSRARVAGRTFATLPPYQYIVIVRMGDRFVGLVVDQVDDVVAVARTAVESPGEVAGVPLPGVVRVGDDLVLVLGPEHVSHVGA